MQQTRKLEGEFVLTGPAHAEEQEQSVEPEVPPEEPVEQPPEPDEKPEPSSRKAKLLTYKQKQVVGPFSDLCLYPQHVTFESQEKNEEIVLLVRRHFVTNIPWILLVILLAIFPPFGLYLTPIFFPVVNITFITGLAYVLFYYLVLFGFALLRFSLWYFHVGLITTKRIVDVDISGFFFKDVSEADVDSIQDITYRQYGAIQSLFNYGNISIQTEAHIPNFEFDRIPQPARVTKIISDIFID